MSNTTDPQIPNNPNPTPGGRKLSMSNGLRDPEAVRDILRMRAEKGMTNAEIGAVFGVSRDTIRQVFRSQGIKMSKEEWKKVNEAHMNKEAMTAGRLNVWTPEAKAAMIETQRQRWTPELRQEASEARKATVVRMRAENEKMCAERNAKGGAK